MKEKRQQNIFWIWKKDILIKKKKNIKNLQLVDNSTIKTDT